MKIADLTDRQLEKICDSNPEWVLANRPEWMFDNRPEFVLDNHPECRHEIQEVPAYILDIFSRSKN